MRQLTVDRMLKSRPETAGASPRLARSRTGSWVRSMMPPAATLVVLPTTEGARRLVSFAAARDRRMETLGFRRIRPWPW